MSRLVFATALAALATVASGCAVTALSGPRPRRPPARHDAHLADRGVGARDRGPLLFPSLP